MSKAAYGAIHAQYTVLEYIESTGTQYIDTGLKANQNTRIIMDHTLMSSGGDASLFGAWDGFASNGFIYVVLSDMTSGYWCYANGTSGISMTAAGRHTVDANQNVLTLDGTTLATATAATFTGSYPMYLFAHNEAGTASNLAAMRFEGCRIYDGDTMVRDYVPVPGPAGVIGLYDRVTDTFYGNAGSGEFIAGPATGEVIDAGSQTRKVKKIYAVMDGLTRKVKKGYAVIGGTTRPFFSAGVSVVYTGTHTVEDASLDGTEYVLYTLTGSGTLTLDGAENGVRYWMCGGGTGGGGSIKKRKYTDGGRGGNGGYTAEGVLSSGVYVVTIGAGGAAAAVGGVTGIGGTAVLANTLDAGGSGGGAGGSYNSLSPGTGQGTATVPFGMASLGAHSAGGGGGQGTRDPGGGSSYTIYQSGAGGSNGSDGGAESEGASSGGEYIAAGGEKGGGSGGNGLWSIAATAATFYGSGGGGGSDVPDNTSYTNVDGAPGAAGYQGVAYILIPKEAM